MEPRAAVFSNLDLVPGANSEIVSSECPLQLSPDWLKVNTDVMQDKLGGAALVSVHVKIPATRTTSRH